MSIPAQHGKSTTVLSGVAWLLRRQPAWPIAYVTYAQDKADDQSLIAQRVALSAGAITGHDRQTLRTWSTPQGGSAFFTGIGGPLTGNPARLLLIDEPSIGLEPRAITQVFEMLHGLQDHDGVSILLVEQNVRQGLLFADLGYVLVAGRVVAAASGAELLQDPSVGRMFLG